MGANPFVGQGSRLLATDPTGDHDGHFLGTNPIVTRPEQDLLWVLLYAKQRREAKR